MPLYDFEDPETGVVITVEGDRQPTDDDLKPLFREAYQTEATRYAKKAKWLRAGEVAATIVSGASPTTMIQAASDVYRGVKQNVKELAGLGDVQEATPEQVGESISKPIAGVLGLGERGRGIVKGVATSAAALGEALPEAAPAAAIGGIPVAAQFSVDMIKSAADLWKQSREASKAGDVENANSLRVQALLNAGMGIGIPLHVPAANAARMVKERVSNAIRENVEIRKELKREGLTDAEVAEMQDAALDLTIPEQMIWMERRRMRPVNVIEEMNVGEAGPETGYTRHPFAEPGRLASEGGKPGFLMTAEEKIAERLGEVSRFGPRVKFPLGQQPVEPTALTPQNIEIVESAKPFPGAPVLLKESTKAVEEAAKVPEVGPMEPSASGQPSVSGVTSGAVEPAAVGAPPPAAVPPVQTGKPVPVESQLTPKEQYNRAAMDIGVEPETYKRLSEDESDVVETPKEYSGSVEIGPSSIEGKGVLSSSYFGTGVDVVPILVNGKNRTQVGRYINHLDNPNTVPVLGGSGDIMLRTVKPIAKGDELTVDYRQVEAVKSRLLEEQKPEPTKPTELIGSSIGQQLWYHSARNNTQAVLDSGKLKGGPAQVSLGKPFTKAPKSGSVDIVFSSKKSTGSGQHVEWSEDIVSGLLESNLESPDIDILVRDSRGNMVSVKDAYMSGIKEEQSLREIGRNRLEPTKPAAPAVEPGGLIPEWNSVLKRLRDAQRLLNAESKRAFGRATVDQDRLRLISQDGKWALQYYPPGAKMPRGETAGSVGSVHIEAIQPGGPNAIQERGAAPIPVGETPEGGAKVGGQVRNAEELAAAQEARTAEVQRGNAPEAEVDAPISAVSGRPITTEGATPRAETPSATPKPVETAEPSKAKEVTSDAEKAQVQEVKKPSEPSGPQSLGIVPPGTAVLAQMIKPAKIRSWLLRNWTKERGLPEDAYVLELNRRGDINSAAVRIRDAATDLRNAIAEEFGLSKTRVAATGFGRSVPRDFFELVNSVLSGADSPNVLPERIRAPVQAMRNHIDELSSRLRNSDLISDELRATIDENLGVYLTRSYRVFEDPKWVLENVPMDIVNQARKIIEVERSMTPEQAQSILENLFSDWKQYGISQIFKPRRLGSKDLSVLMHRKDIRPEFRALMGEYKDPFTNYVRSASKVAKMLADHDFLSGIKEIGMNRWLFEDGKNPVGYNTLISSESNPAMEPLNGLRTSEHLARVFNEWNVLDKESNAALRAYYALNTWSKMAKTVFSPMTQARNLSSQPLFWLANGHYNPLYVREAVRHLRSSFTSEKAWRDYEQKLAKYNLVDESVFMGELRDSLNDFSSRYMDQDISPTEYHTGLILKHAFYNVPRKIYKISDEFGKVVGWENEKARLRRDNPTWSEDRVESEAAIRIRNTYPTYSNVSEMGGLTKTIRKVPFVGPFFPFSYEMVRTTGHNVLYGLQDIKAGHYRSGAERLAGTMAAVGVASVALQSLSRFMTGITKDDDRDLRRKLPEYEKNSTFLYTGKEPGKISRFNLSFNNPYSYLSDPFFAAVIAYEDDKKAWDAMWAFAKEAFSPFANEQMLSRAIREAMTGVRDDQTQVWNPEHRVDEKWKRGLTHVLRDALLPGGVVRFKTRFMPAYRQEPGQESTATKEAIAELTGFREQTHNFKTTLKFSARRFEDGIRNSSRIFSEGIRSEKPSADILGQYIDSEEARLRVWTNLYRDVRSAIRQGVPMKDIQEQLEQSGVSKLDLRWLLAGRYRPYIPSDDIIKGAKTAGKEIPIADIREFARPRFKLMLE